MDASEFDFILSVLFIERLKISWTLVYPLLSIQTVIMVMQRNCFTIWIYIY